MFLLKKLITIFIMPLWFGMILALTGLALVWFTKRRSAGRALTTAGIAYILVFSFQPLSNALLWPLEHTYPRYTLPAAHVQYISVLGGGHRSDTTMPITSQLGKGSVIRLIEGVRIQRLNPGSRLIVSGYPGLWDSIPNAVVMARVACALGVDSTAIIVEPRPKDTEEESAAIQKIVGVQPFVLVTSASHMKRAVALFRRLGCNPIPAPTDFETHRGKNPFALVPSSEGLKKSEIWFYETVGIIWLKLRGKA
jgi:uncharacterized SAM-binding protein YcdF (DUF218 family)